MPAIQASRRLVKSPPELWAEVSDAASLARHLGEVGEITITRLEPETTVAWEGEHASGTVELAPAGWGTAVTLTAEPTGDAEPPAAAPEPAAVAAAPEPAATAEQPAAPEPVGIEETASIAMPTRRGWLARFLRRKQQSAVTESAATPAPEPSAADADRAGGDEDARPPAEGPVGARPQSTGPARQAAEPEQEPQQREDPLEAILANALDSLGQAHHRPFSRG